MASVGEERAENANEIHNFKSALIVEHRRAGNVTSANHETLQNLNYCSTLFAIRSLCITTPNSARRMRSPNRPPGHEHALFIAPRNSFVTNTTPGA
jgi:hypothetical protein